MTALICVIVVASMLLGWIIGYYQGLDKGINRAFDSMRELRK